MGSEGVHWPQAAEIGDSDENHRSSGRWERGEEEGSPERNADADDDNDEDDDDDGEERGAHDSDSDYEPLAEGKGEKQMRRSTRPRRSTGRGTASLAEAYERVCIIDHPRNFVPLGPLDYFKH